MLTECYRKGSFQLYIVLRSNCEETGILLRTGPGDPNTRILSSHVVPNSILAQSISHNEQKSARDTAPTGPHTCNNLDSSCVARIDHVLEL